MSWSVTVNDLQKMTDVEALPDSVLEKIGLDNPFYMVDAMLAFKLAKQRRLKSATLSGARTPSPYGQPDVVVISVVGFDGEGAEDFNQTMLGTIVSRIERAQQEENARRAGDVSISGSDSPQGGSVGDNPKVRGSEGAA